MRTRCVRGFSWVLACLLVGSVALHAQEAPVTAVRSIGMTVSDLEQSVEFYTQVLSFERGLEVEVSGSDYEHLQGISGLRMRVVRLSVGDEFIELTEYVTPKGRAYPTDSRSNDRWFQHIAIIVSDMEQAYERLLEHEVEHVSQSPQRLPDSNPNAGGIKAFYFKDPDGHVLEVLQFPPDKGDRKWHRPTDRLFLGIDHTAIVVSDTDASLAFYRDTLGLRIAGKSENYGPEQERLNDVSGARLRITALRAARGPGIEFLEYLTPRDGRPMPADERANDLLHWQTRLVSEDFNSVANILLSVKTPLISSGPVRLPKEELGFINGILVRDPDGHVIQLVEE